MLTNHQVGSPLQSSRTLDTHLSALYDSNAYNKDIIDHIRTFYIYAQSGKLTLTRRHGQAVTSLYFADGTLIQLESTETDLDTSPKGVRRSILQILGWRDATLAWEPYVYPEERPLEEKIHLLFAEIDRIHQSKQTRSWGSETCKLITAKQPAGARLPLNLQILCLAGGWHEFTLVSEKTIIGRDPHLVDLSIPTSSLSRKHALIHVGETGVFIQDFDTRNGTYVNDQRLKPSLFYPVTEADEIYLADTRLILEPAPEIVAEALKIKAQSQIRRLKRHIQNWNLG